MAENNSKTTLVLVITLILVSSELIALQLAHAFNPVQHTVGKAYLAIDLATCKRVASAPQRRLDV